MSVLREKKSIKIAQRFKNVFLLSINNRLICVNVFHEEAQSHCVKFAF